MNKFERAKINKIESNSPIPSLLNYTTTDPEKWRKPFS